MNEKEGKARAGKLPPELETRVAALVLRRSALTKEEKDLFRAVFQFLVRAHYKRVRTVLRRRGVPVDKIRDTTQSVLDSFFRLTCENGFPESIPRRLDEIAVGKASNLRRKKKKAPLSVPLPSSRSEVPRSGPDLVHLLALQDMWARLLPMLTPDQQGAIQAIYFDDMSYEGAAEALGIKVDTLSARLASAKRVLAGMVAAFFPEMQGR